MLKGMREDGLIEGWRDELFPAIPSFDAQPLCLIERAAVTYFGLKVGPSPLLSALRLLGAPLQE